MAEVPLHVIHLNQDDPRKCTARAMHSRAHVVLHEHPRGAPRRGILLNPHAGLLQGQVKIHAHLHLEGVYEHQ